MDSKFFTLVVATLLASAAVVVTASWRGPYDTHDKHSLWLRRQMERPRPWGVHSSATLNILSFGAVPGNTSYAASVKNGEAIRNCMLAANASKTEKTCLIPAGQSFEVIPAAHLKFLFNVSLQLEGNVSAFQGSNHSLWPDEHYSHSNKVMKRNLFDFRYCTELSLFGSGVVHGHGFAWWLPCFTKPFTCRRPNLLDIAFSQHVTIDGWTLLDSPRYHIKMQSVGALVQHVTIRVSVFDQYALHKKHGTFLYDDDGATADFITFPLNTDGIDVRGNTVVVRNCHVENFDDALCAKPMDKTSTLGCTHNLLFTNSTIHLGVGATIGSVGPSAGNNCATNITFNHITSRFPIKGIYVKPNPGNYGTGTIDNILYENFHAVGALWWAIWVSTQQQDQPGGGADTGCSFFYPLAGQKCQTQPRVPVTALHMKNVSLLDSLLSPGVLRCNNTNVGPGSGPCSNWNWENVQASSILKWPFGEHFLCHAIEKPQWINVKPGCQFNQEEAALSRQEDHHHHRRVLLQSLLQKKSHPSKQMTLTEQERLVLSELARRMKAEGRSLYDAMIKLHGRRGARDARK